MGCARIARKVCRAINLSPNATVRAIASRSIEKAEAFAAENGLLKKGKVRLYGSYIELVNDPFVDAIYMPLPTSVHLEWGVLCASKKKHLLIEKPTALDTTQLEVILEACEANGVQFMDGTMWYHHPRTAKIKDILTHSTLVGDLHWVSCSSSFLGDEEFQEKNIRVRPDCDALGALGDLGWYCIGPILWALNYQLPTFVVALPEASFNSKGVNLACNASLHWETAKPETVATFYCSFLSHVSMDLTICGSRGSIRLDDLAIPRLENSASFRLSTETRPGLGQEDITVESRLPQEAFMVQEFTRLVKGIKSFGERPDKKWAQISKKTQLVVDAVRKSVDIGFKPVYL